MNDPTISIFEVIREENKKTRAEIEGVYDLLANLGQYRRYNDTETPQEQENSHRLVKIEEWPYPEEQECRLGRHVWSVARLIIATSHLPVFEIPVRHLNLSHTYEKLNMRELVTHIKAIERASLGEPIILDEDGEIMDGRHRILKALWLGQETVKAVRFDKNPSPCRVED